MNYIDVENISFRYYIFILDLGIQARLLKNSIQTRVGQYGYIFFKSVNISKYIMYIKFRHMVFMVVVNSCVAHAKLYQVSL